MTSLFRTLWAIKPRPQRFQSFISVPPPPNYFLGKKLDEVESYTVISIAVFYKDFCDYSKARNTLGDKLQHQVAATNHSVCTGSNTLRRDKSLQECVLENYCENLVPYDCNRILHHNKSHKFCLIWFLATCCCDQILSQRRRF